MGRGPEKKSEKSKRATEQVNVRQRHVEAPQQEPNSKTRITKSSTKPSPAIGEDPLFWFHTKARKALSNTPLFSTSPPRPRATSIQADYKPGVKLYVKRVFILDDSKDLLPQYLRFVRGIIDSEDLPLNVSRELLQQNKVLTSIRTASVKKILSELKSLSEKDAPRYLEFIEQYNRPLKEGLYNDYTNRDGLLDLVRFKSTKVEGLTSLADVKSRMTADQKSIYTITGGSESLLRTSPLLEIYKKKNLEVLILDDEIDEIVFSGIDKYGEIDIKAVNKSATSEDLKDASEPDQAEALKPLLDKLKATLGDKVADVRASVRLADSPSCIVSDEDAPTLQMQQMLRAMGQKDLPAIKPTLEINPDHEIVKKLLAHPESPESEDAAWLLFDQALLMEGVPLTDPALFVKRLNRILTLSL